MRTLASAYAPIQRAMSWLFDFIAYRRRSVRLAAFIGLVAHGWELRGAVAWWYIALLLVNGAGLVWVLWFMTRLDESVMRVLANRSRQHREGIEQCGATIARLHAELDARADDVAAYDAQCLDAEHKLVATWNRAAENLRLAMHWRFVAESNAKRAEHWEYIAKQNAAGYEQMSGVVMTHLRHIGGEEAVAAVANDLEAFERSQN